MKKKQLYYDFKKIRFTESTRRVAERALGMGAGAGGGVVPWFLQDELADGLAAGEATDQDRSNLPCNSQIRYTTLQI